MRDTAATHYRIAIAASRKRPYAPLIDISNSSDLPQQFFKILLELLHLGVRLSTHICNLSARSAFGARSVFG